jgi:phosphoribosylformylglycinamidine cyclo-ligase
MAHITGGGLPGNLARALPPTLDAEVDLGSWEVPHLFRVLERAGQVPRDEMFRAFNMGVGMVVITDPASADRVRDSAERAGVAAWRLGRVTPGGGRVILK